RALEVIAGIKDSVKYREVASERELVKVSIVGAGMVSNPGVAAKMFKTISDLGININMVSTSEIKVSAVIKQDKLNEVVVALHTAYGLDTSEQVFVGGPAERR